MNQNKNVSRCELDISFFSPRLYKTIASMSESIIWLYAKVLKCYFLDKNRLFVDISYNYISKNAI